MLVYLKNSKNKSESILYVVFFVLGLAWTVSLWLRSPGTPYQDEIGHVLLSYDSWRDPRLALDIWGRVIHTLIYMVPSVFGLQGARLMSVLLSCVTVVVTTCLALKLGLKSLYLIPLFLWFQPWFSGLMYTAITQTPFALFLVGATYLWVTNRYIAASILFGCMPLIRHEAVGLLGLWILILLAQRRDWRALVASGLPIALYNLAYFAFVTTSIQDLPMALYFHPTPTAKYGSGGWLHYVPSVITGVGLPSLVWSIYGFIREARQPQKVLWLSGYAVYFALHTVIYRFGLFASGGYGLFVSPIAPAFAVLAALGADALIHYPALWILLRDRLRRLLPRAVFASLVVAPVILVGLSEKPRLLRSEEVAVYQAVGWVKTHYTTPPENVVATHVWFGYLYGLSTVELRSRQVPGMLPPGTVAVWDWTCPQF